MSGRKKTEMETITFTIPVSPVTKKNHSRIVWIRKKGKKIPIIKPSAAYIDYEAKAKRFCPGLYLNVPVNVEAHYYMETRTRVDLTNLHEALHDVMVAAKTVMDDNSSIIVSTDGSRVHYDRDNPRTEVTITMQERTENED